VDKGRASGSNDLSFDDMGLDFGFTGSGRSGTALAMELGTGAGVSVTVAQPVAQAVAQPVAPAPAPAPLPLEDAKELDKFLCKVDEAMRAMARMSVDTERVSVALPQNALGKRQKETIDEHWKICKEKEVTLRHIAVHNKLPGHNAKVTASALKAILNEFHDDYTELKQAVAMAQPLLKSSAAKSRAVLGMVVN
jgi:hypothetical protein